ncbi:beta-mannosidase [Halobiforma haloterrestris]|uniref:Beta-mannosidase n=1 Tax=Natronobacterium haloterrestre TaxID=148448 RepID=A0A1I1DDA1_NATHA|nr:glycoside hydrolase family 2 [Halobiforma haloterrestris]SFB72794.1 beta-mannosidase [Halobiforma haloterrestris]
MTDEWTGGRIVDWGEADTEGPPTVAEWRPVAVPAQRPEFGRDGDEEPGPDLEAVAYRTTLADPRSSDRADERALLEIRGGYGRMAVWFNGTKLGESDPHFVPARYTVDPEPTNDLVVACERPDAFAGIRATDEVPASFATPGVRWNVDLEPRPATFLRRVKAHPRLERGERGEGTDDPRGEIDVEIEIDAGTAVDDAITLSVRPEERGGGATMERIPVTAEAGERTTVSRTVEVRDPSLWWPRGYGPQHRYAVRAKLGADAAERTVGFRRVERDADGFLVNGTRVRARGFTRLPGGDPEADVRRALEANATLVRARGHVPSQALHEACDEAGLLVWQDLPASGPEFAARLSDADEGDDVIERGRRLATVLADEYGHHPSIACYGVQDEPATPFDDPVGSGFTGKLAVRYRAWRTAIDRAPAEAIAEAFPGDVPVLPVAGQPGTDPDAAHLFPGWQYLEATDLSWLLETYPSLGEVVGGFGAGTLADEVDPASVPGLDADAYARRAGEPAASREYQTRTLKTLVETLRRRECGIFAGPPIRDAAAGGGMGVTTAEGEPKPAYEAVSDSLEPVQAVLDDPPTPGDSVGITLCNDTDRSLEAAVGWRAGDETGETTVPVGALETTPVGSLTVPTDASAVELAVEAGSRSATNRYSL